jgi:hypothetical protein
MKNPHLHRYWIEFDTTPDDTVPPMRRQCGVTAYTIDDALMIVQAQLFAPDAIPPVLRISEDFDVSTLNANHILPNIGLTTHRGIWFPNRGPYQP